MAKTLIDYILPEDYDRFNELLDMAEAAKEQYKKDHPTERKARGPQTPEQKLAAAQAKYAKAKAALEALLAGNTDETETVAEGE